MIERMGFEDYQQKKSVVLVYTGEGKGKTSASLGLMVRALGHGRRVAFAQFIKNWIVGEDKFIRSIMDTYQDKLSLVKGGKGFYNAGSLSAKDVSEDDHRQAALKTYNFVINASQKAEYDLIICDEINNAVADGLLTQAQLKRLLKTRSATVSLCLTGRNFPKELLKYVDIATQMTKIKHHYDDKFLANEGIDY